MSTELANGFSFASPHWWLVFITGALAAATYFLYRATVNLGRDAKNSGQKQLEKMQASVDASTRSAQGIEGLSVTTTANVTQMQAMMQKQMRAYVSVEIGVATFQDDAHVFQAHPKIINTGFTPARNVEWAITAAIKDFSNEDRVEFSETRFTHTSDVSLAPRQEVVLHSNPVDRVPEDEVDAIKCAATRRLCVWGKIAYDDVFDHRWQTEFAITYAWLNNGPMGYYFNRHNKAA